MFLSYADLQSSLAKAKCREVNDDLRYHGICIVDRTAWAHGINLNTDAEPTTIFVRTACHHDVSF